MNAEIGQQIWSFAGQLIAAGGGGAVVAFWIFRYLGKSWIEHQFASELEASKSELSVLAARRLKMHDREHVVFPELWSRLNKVLTSLDRVVISMRQIPDFKRFTPSGLASWVECSDLTDDERSYFTSEQFKDQAYIRILDRRDLLEARGDFVAFHTYLRDSRIFLSPDIKGKLDEIDKSISRSLTAKEMDWGGYGRGSGKDFLMVAMDTLDEKVKPLMVEIDSRFKRNCSPKLGKRSGLSDYFPRFLVDPEPYKCCMPQAFVGASTQHTQSLRLWLASATCMRSSSLL